MMHFPQVSLSRLFSKILTLLYTLLSFGRPSRKTSIIPTYHGNLRKKNLTGLSFEFKTGLQVTNYRKFLFQSGYLQTHIKLTNSISKNKKLYIKDLFKLCKLENFEASLIPYFWVPFHWNLWIISRHSLKYQDCQCTTSFKNKNFELALKKHLLQLLGHLLFETFDRCQAYNSSVCKKIQSKIL